jgi:phage gpG-like protein
MSITIQVNNAPLQQRLTQIEEALSPTHLARALGDVGEQVVEEIKQRIEGNEQWGGGPFAPNTAVTLAKKRGSKPLINTGSFVSSRIFYHVAGDALELRANAAQAAVLQFGAKQGQFGRTKRGGPIPWGNIPARPYMPIDAAGNLHPEAHQFVMQILEDYVDSITQR